MCDSHYRTIVTKVSLESQQKEHTQLDVRHHFCMAGATINEETSLQGLVAFHRWSFWSFLNGHLFWAKSNWHEPYIPLSRSSASIGCPSSLENAILRILPVCFRFSKSKLKPSFKLLVCWCSSVYLASVSINANRASSRLQPLWRLKNNTFL